MSVFLAFTTGLLAGILAMAAIFSAVCMDKLNETTVVLDLTRETLERYRNEEIES